MSLYIKLLITLIIAGTIGGGYYAYTQYQQKQQNGYYFLDVLYQ